MIWPGVLIIQSVILWPLSVRYALANDPGLLGTRRDVRRRRLRTVPVVISATILGVAAFVGGFRSVSLLWVVMFVVGWSMKHHPEEAKRMKGGGLPTLPVAGEILIAVLVGSGAVALGQAVH